jgi:tetratricopeptide (TPR) repeat protein
MWRYWQKRGHLAEARRRLDAIASQPWSRDDPVLRARLMEALGGVGWWTADPAVMVPAYDEALELWQAIGDKREIANALYNRSFKFALETDPAKNDPDGSGFQAMNEALRLFREVGDDHGAANALWGIGNIRYFKNAPDQGIEYVQQALEIFRQQDDQSMEAWSLHMIGTGLIRLGRFGEASGVLRDALRLFHAAGDVAGITLALDDLASEAVGLGDLPRAAQLWGAARALSAASGVGLADLVDTTYEYSNRPNARTSMDPADLGRYALVGRSMTLDESVAFALGVPVDQVQGPHEHAGGTPG